MVPVGSFDLDRDTPVTRDVRRAAESDPDLSADSSSALHTAAADRRRMKVLVIVPSLCVGGAETDLARNLPFVDRTRFEIVVCTFLERGGLAGQLTAAGI